jgi:tetratricopeptide (TPR) repeat protein
MADRPDTDPPARPLADILRDALRLHENGEPAEAIPLYEKVIAANPETAQLCCLLGVAVKQTGDLGRAIPHLEKACALDPTRPDLAAECAIAYTQAGLAEKAVATFADALPKLQAAGGDDALVYAAAGDAHFACRQWTQAAAHYNAALEKQPENTDVRLNYGVALHHTDRFDEAIAAYEAVLAANPDHAGALTNLGVALQETRRFAESLAALERAAALSPEDALTLSDLGVTLQKLGRTDEAIAAFSRAIAADPNYARAWSNMGNALQDKLDLTEAFEAHRRAIALEPENAELHWNLAMTLLLAGEYETGWPEYEWRRRRDGAFSLPAEAGPEWQGEALDGKSILLAAEQGIGDALHFARFAPLLAARGATVSIRAHTALKTLLATLDGVAAVLGPDDPLPAADVTAPLMSLPLKLGLALADIESAPDPTPYLRVPDGTLPPLSGESTTPRVGIVWAGNPGHANDHNRSCPAEALAPLFNIGGIEWISLQKDRRGDLPGPATDLAESLGSFADTAVAHLAGALAKPVWIMLPFSPDWRWLTEREESPWYPSARLFRQPAPGDWPGTIAAVASALKQQFD